MTDTKKGKNIFKSKTFWLNILSAIGFIASGQAGIDVPADVATPILGAANIAARFLTNKPVYLPPRTPAP